MIDEAKLQRLLELKEQRDEIERQINALLGGEPVKRKWTRRIQPQETPAP